MSDSIADGDARRRLGELRARLRRAGIKGDEFWAAEMLDCLYSADSIVDRGEKLFFDEDNTVEIAAARQHVIDLDTAAEKITPSFKQASLEIPWGDLARARDRFAHHDDNVNRDVVWNVLVIEFPKIRAVLMHHLELS